MVGNRGQESNPLSPYQSLPAGHHLTINVTGILTGCTLALELVAVTVIVKVPGGVPSCGGGGGAEPPPQPMQSSTANAPVAKPSVECASWFFPDKQAALFPAGRSPATRHGRQSWPGEAIASAKAPVWPGPTISLFGRLIDFQTGLRSFHKSSNRREDVCEPGVLSSPGGALRARQSLCRC